MAGDKLGSYEILSPLGAGGMGEVYRARDTKLGREVAIKVLPEEFTQHPQKLARFEREARLLAALNHPGIATLYGVEESQGKPFLVMELVEGETLAERIAKGPIPVDEALPLFIQMAEGLEAAHEKGIIHRDLKPANVKITPEGKLKILDFGLVKAFTPEEEVSEAMSQSPTLTKGTALGVILGTASYTSPEQARGKPVDKRTDIWAFGCCLYEALTGKIAFGGDTVTDILAAVVHREPDWGSLPASTPWRLRELLERCLRKASRGRLRDIGDARIQLATADTAPSYEAPASQSRRHVHTALGAVVGAIVASAAVYFLIPDPPRPTSVHFREPLPDQVGQKFSPPLREAISGFPRVKGMLARLSYRSPASNNQTSRPTAVGSPTNRTSPDRTRFTSTVFRISENASPHPSMEEESPSGLPRATSSSTARKIA